MHGPHWLSKSSVSPCVYRDHPPQRADPRAWLNLGTISTVFMSATCFASAFALVMSPLTNELIFIRDRLNLAQNPARRWPNSPFLFVEWFYDISSLEPQTSRKEISIRVCCHSLGDNALLFLRTRSISGIVQRGGTKGQPTVKKTALLRLALLTVSYPVMAKSHHDHHHAVRKSQQTHHSVATDPRSQVTCETVRSYVAQVGLERAKAMALSANISISDKERAKRCLGKST
jgi:hypothetical protein